MSMLPYGDSVESTTRGSVIAGSMSIGKDTQQRKNRKSCCFSIDINHHIEDSPIALFH